MELIENLLQLLVTFTGACLAGFACWKSKKQQYFLLLCFYGCFALGAAITFHAIYNLLIAYGGAAQYVAYALPVLLMAAGKLSALHVARNQEL